MAETETNDNTITNKKINCTDSLPLKRTLHYQTVFQLGPFSSDALCLFHDAMPFFMTPCPFSKSICHF